MVKKISLEATSRTDTNGKAKAMIRQGFIPAALYGSGILNKNLKLKRQDFEHVFKDAGETHLVDLNVDGKENFRVLIKDIQRDIIKGKIIHADFYQVDMKKKIEVEVPLHFINESKAIKEMGGTLVKSIDSLNIRCLPDDLIDKVDVDISVLATYEDAIHVKDLKLPGDIEVLNNQDDMVVHVMAATIEEVAPAPAVEEAAAVAEGEAKVEGEANADTGKKGEVGKKADTSKKEGK